MTYRFEGFELDPDKAELRCDGATIPLEPQVFALLVYLVENRERLVTKDQIIDDVWDGRIVSESAITSRIKSARRAVGDNGKEQRFIRTIHGSGYRFVADVEAGGSIEVPENATAAPEAAHGHDTASRPSIAVLPFRWLGVAGSYAAIADALPHEIIAELSRLRWLFVIARASSFQFPSDEPDLGRIGTSLNVRYCLSGAVELLGHELRITIELAETSGGGVLWGERYQAEVGRLGEVRAEILARVIGGLELQISTHEARRARLSSTEDLDAWASYHLGLNHMFRFNRDDNARASELFRKAIDQDPSFARAHAGMSFTRFQDAFLRYDSDVDAASRDAKRYAERSVELDSMDPFANLVLGRTFWLQADLDSSLSWLERAKSLSPNYAQGVYALAFANTISGHGQAGQADADLAMSLSPLDPLYYAMLSCRALSHLVRQDFDEAAHWAERGANAPGAHALVDAIAAIAHTLAGDSVRAEARMRRVRRRDPGLTRAEFFRSFPFAVPEARERISGALRKLGL